jgi:hypothetical protein
MTVSLPGIERIGCDMDAGRTTATCWFENGARLRYRETKFGSVVAEAFRTDDPDSVAKSEVIADENPPSAPHNLLWSLEAYCSYRSGEVTPPTERPDVNEKRGYWPWFEVVAAPAGGSDRDREEDR